VDKAACAKQGVLVMNDPVSNGRSVAEMVIGEIIGVSRRLFESVEQMRTSLWKKDSLQRFEVQGKRIGILGLGKIGRQVAQLAQAMGMEVYFRDMADVPKEVGIAMGWHPVKNTEELFRIADFVTIHVSAEDPHGRPNRNIITAEHLRAFADKPYDGPRIFLNLARGLIVDPDVLKEAVRERHATYVITDVFPEEPGEASTKAWVNPYEGEPRILATPHIGAATAEAQPRIARYVARTTQLFNEFGMIRNCVYEPRAVIDFDVSMAKSMLAVVHVDKRGTKKAVDDAIYNSGASNIRSAHVDFPKFGIAYDLSALDQHLTQEQCDALVAEATSLTRDPTAIRWVRTIDVSPQG
jgi:D-3-phosphoglycerate dehydrogenase